MTHTKQVLERFEEEFANLLQLHISNDKDRYFDEKENVKSFLLSSHTSYLEKQIEWLRGEKYPSIEGGSKELPYTDFPTAKPAHESNEVFMQYAHNSALQSVIDHLQEELKEIKEI